MSLVTGLPPLVCKSIARASKLRILPSGDAYITDLVLDIAATASHTSVRPSKTAQRHPSARRRGPLPTAGCHSLRPARPSAGLQPSPNAAHLARGAGHHRGCGKPRIGRGRTTGSQRCADNRHRRPRCHGVVNLTRRTYLGDDIDQAKVGALHGICASAVRPTTRCA